MKIGYIQFQPSLDDVEKTISDINLLIDQAAEADLLVLPELCNSGYNVKSRERAFHSSEVAGSGVFSRYLIEKCKEHNLFIVSGLNERVDDKLYNSSILVGKEGLIGRYQKLHLFMNEPDFFKPGSLGLPTFEINGVRIGMLICFDWFFPEVWRVLALKKVDVVCHPSNLVLPGFAQKTIPVHALLNRYYVVTANRIGSEDDLTFTGLSIIADPKGDVLNTASIDQSDSFITKIDLSNTRNKSITARNNLFSDRRPVEYQELIK